jgi:hypothetical protein
MIPNVKGGTIMIPIRLLILPDNGWLRAVLIPLFTGFFRQLKLK